MSSLRFLLAFVVLSTPALASQSPGDTGSTIASFYSGVTGTTTWTGEAAFSQLSEEGTLSTMNVPVSAYIHLLGANHWSVGVMICQATQCYYEGDETDWSNGTLNVHRYDGNTIVAQVTEATPTSLAYTYNDPYGDLPTDTEVREEILGEQFIRHTLIRVGALIYEDYLFSVARAPAPAAN
jgi:hypothetical protein